MTETPLKAEQSTVRTHIHKGATTSWQPSQGLTSISFSDLTAQTDFENPLYAVKSSDSVIFPLNQEFGPEQHPEYSHMISESTVYHQTDFKSKTHHQNATDSVTPTGSVSQIDINPPKRGTDSQQRRLDRINFSLNMLRSPESLVHLQASSDDQKELQGTVTPDHVEGRDGEETEGDEKKEEIVFHHFTGPEGGDMPFKVKTAQQERSHEESESSNYKKTTAEPSTSSPRKPEFLTTPMVHFITTTTQLPVGFTLDTEPSRKPGQMLFNLHSEDKEEVTEKEEDRKNPPNVFVKADGGKIHSTIGPCILN